MTAEFWTTNGSDIWRLKDENLDTKEVVRCDVVSEVMDAKFTPVIMPKVKKPAPIQVEGTKAKKKTAKKAVKSSRSRAKSKYKGVSPSKTPGKFRVQFWDGTTNVGLGTFDSELLAAAAYQERIGNHEEARRLRNEYEEGNCMPETSEMEDKPTSTGEFPSEE